VASRSLITLIILEFTRTGIEKVYVVRTIWTYDVPPHHTCHHISLPESIACASGFTCPVPVPFAEVPKACPLPFIRHTNTQAQPRAESGSYREMLGISWWGLAVHFPPPMGTPPTRHRGIRGPTRSTRGKYSIIGIFIIPRRRDYRGELGVLSGFGDWKIERVAGFTDGGNRSRE